MRKNRTSMPSKDNNAVSGAAGLSPLIFNIGVSGMFSDPLPHEVSLTIKHFFSDLIEVLRPYQQERYGFMDSGLTCNLFFTATDCDLPFDQLLSDPFTFYCIYPRDAAQPDLPGQSISKIHKIHVDLPDPIDPNANHELTNWMVEQSDLFFTLWNGTKEYDNCRPWNLILQASRKGIPVIWLDPARPDQLYIHKEGLNLPLTTGHLEKYCRELLGLNNSTEKMDELQKLTGAVKIHRNFGSSFYRHFTNQFKKIPAPLSKDDLLEDKTILPAEFKPFEEKYKTMKAAYKRADWISMIENGNYRSALLFRAILPLLANFVLIFGFYGKNIIGTSKTFGDTQWDIVIGASFMFQAFFTFLIIRISDQNEHKGWHRLFVDQRYIAEVLRLAIHFTPINLPLNNSSAAISSNRLPKDSPVSHLTRSLLRATSINSNEVASSVEKEFFFSNTEKLLSHQIEYHRYTAKKNKIIFKKLSTIARVLFWIGIGAIFARVALQIFFVGRDLNTALDPLKFAATKTHLSAIFNLLALIMPSAGATAFSILNLCGFRDLYLRSEQMVENLQMLKILTENESRREDLAYDDYCRLARQISTVLLQETTDWYAMINGKKITRN